MSARASIGELSELAFTLLDDDGVTPIVGAVGGDFTAVALVGSVLSAQPVTVSESAQAGVYVAELTPDVPGRWLARVIHDETGQVHECQIDVGGDAIAHSMAVIEGSTVYIESWLQRDGEGVIATTSCTVVIYDRDGAVVASTSSMSPDARGHFTMSSAIALTANRPYNVITTIADARGSVRSYEGLATVQG